MREELVQSAVKFLSHTTVRSSPVTSRRSFLEEKGLTKDEIDEAFRRVPDPLPNLTIGQSLTSNQDVQSKPFTNIQPQPTGLVASPPPRFSWSHAFVAVGVLTASGAGIAILLKNFILPGLKSWIRKVVLEAHDGSTRKSKPSLLEEVTAAAKTASIAAADAAKASMGIMNSKNKERQYFEALMKRLNIQVAEMRSMSNAIQKLEGPLRSLDSKDSATSLLSSVKAKTNGVSNIDGSVRPSSAPASMGPSVGQHPKSYMEILAMIQRGEIPPGIKEINDSPPNPDQPLPNPSMAPRTKPWEVAQPYNNGTSAWDLGSTSQTNNDRVLPWWRQRNVQRTESESANGMKTNVHNAMTDERLVQHPWVSPHPFSAAMPRAADAIRLS